MRLEADSVSTERVQIRFSDDGLGIAESDLARVFEPFFTTKRGQGCIGLGLHTVFNLVHARLGGQVSVRSQPGEGTCFTIEIPLAAPA